VGAISEVIEAPLSVELLGERYRALCTDRLYENIPGKIELDRWGRMVMSPASNYHGWLQANLVRALAVLGGRTTTEASVLSAHAVYVADVAWATAEFASRHGTETPFTRAPEICIEIVSPSNSRKGLMEKVEAYLSVGAIEAWIVFPQSKRIEFYGANGLLEQSRYTIESSAIFE
jgi:Uma2 family endonuclease